MQPSLDSWLLIQKILQDETHPKKSNRIFRSRNYRN
jgi:hypothetical protein